MWFPPTPTNTPQPTGEVEAQVVASSVPDSGTVLFRDNFSSNTNWSPAQNNSGKVSVGGSELTITLLEPEAYVFTTRSEPVLNDFYLEVTLHPGLCSGEDEYGLLFRMTPPSAFYRLGLTCNGGIRLDRILGGTAGSPQPWIRTASVPPGALTSSKVGVLARGENIQVFVNDDFQFEVNDPMLQSGVIGFFARSESQTAMTVTASDLVVYSAEAAPESQ